MRLQTASGTVAITRAGRLHGNVRCRDRGTRHDERPAHLGGRGLVKLSLDGHPRCEVCDAEAR